MGRLFKALMFLIVVGIIAIVGYAYIGDLSPNRVQVNQPVAVDAD
jgi:predicted small integral membrane protein